jgi:hypothetical protein
VEALSAETILVESLDSRGRVQWRERFALDAARRTLTVGRSIHADVTVDDPYAAPLHASLEIAPDGRVLANDLGSVNGLVVCGKRYRNAGAVALADHVLQVGRTRLRIRTGQELLEPERPDDLRPTSLLRHPGWLAGAAALAGVAQLIYAKWLVAPRDLAEGIATSLGTAILVVCAWVAVWALLSRVMQGEWRWHRHAAICLGAAVTLVAAIGLVDLGWFVFALPAWNSRSLWIGALALGCALYLHLINASSLRARRAALIACAVPLLLALGSQWLQDRNRVRDVNHISARMRIYPPSLRLRASEPVEDYFKNAASLRVLADKRLIDALARDPVYDDK